MKLPKALNEATAGAALKYHIKRALERSHSISEFSKNLELSAQNAKFSNNTLKIIEELNNRIKQASEEIKEKARDFSNEKLTNEQIKELLNNAEIPTSGRDAITFGTNNLNPEIVEFLHKNNKKMIIEKANNKELELLQDANFKHPENIRASLDHDAIAHILKRHGVNSVNVKNGEIPITNEDIANYRYIVNNADAILRTLDKYDKEAITAFKQVNGYAVVVEQAINKKNELALKTMFKNNGSYKNNEVYKEFSSTSLNANAKVHHGLSSHSGATENPTQKPLTDQEDLLKTSENLNETTPKPTHLSPLEQANAEKLAKLQHAITPLKEFGKNYPEFALKPKEALEKLLQEKNGQVAGAAFREDLGGIDFVWGNKDYGLEHILEKRKKQYKRLGLTNEQAKERTNELIKEIPNIIQKGLKEEDKPGYAVIILNNSKVVLSKFKGDNELKNHYMITSFEADDKVLRELETIATLSNDYRDGINYSTSNLNEPNLTTNALKNQDLSPLEQANAEKLAKLESEALQSEQEFLKAKEQELKRKEALKKKLEHERGNAGNIESQTKIEVGEDIPTEIQ
ncbi:DUF3519 domain-containing protein, partial [Helicobacter pylori]